jgi:hypothetical protein
LPLGDDSVTLLALEVDTQARPDGDAEFVTKRRVEFAPPVESSECESIHAIELRLQSASKDVSYSAEGPVTEATRGEGQVPANRSSDPSSSYGARSFEGLPSTRVAPVHVRSVPPAPRSSGVKAIGATPSTNDVWGVRSVPQLVLPREAPQMLSAPLYPPASPVALPAYGGTSHQRPVSAVFSSPVPAQHSPFERAQPVGAQLVEPARMAFKVSQFAWFVAGSVFGIAFAVFAFGFFSANRNNGNVAVAPVPTIVVQSASPNTRVTVSNGEPTAEASRELAVPASASGVAVTPVRAASPKAPRGQGARKVAKASAEPEPQAPLPGDLLGAGLKP